MRIGLEGRICKTEKEILFEKIDNGEKIYKLGPFWGFQVFLDIDEKKLKKVFQCMDYEDAENFLNENTDIEQRLIIVAAL